MVLRDPNQWVREWVKEGPGDDAVREWKDEVLCELWCDIEECFDL